MVLSSTYLPVINSNVNVLNTPIKRHRVAEWIFKKARYYAACKRLASDIRTRRE